MSEGKHTLTPWERSEHGGIYPVKTGAVGGGYLILKAGGSPRSKAISKAIEEFAVTACNSYDQDQKTIAALVEACEAFVSALSIEGLRKARDLAEDVLTETALTLAKKD